jgi:trimeric autotransporter adhesin
MKLISLLFFLLFPALASAQTITTIAGTGLAEGVNAQVAQLGTVGPVTLDAQGNVYFFDIEWARVRKLTPAGAVTTIAGNGNFGFSGDGGPAIHASLGSVFGLAVDASGNLFIADSSNNRVRKVDTQGVISTVAGNGTTQTQDGAVATSTGLSYPTSAAIDPLGRLVIAADDYSIHRVEGGIIRRIAGTGQFAFFDYAPDGSLGVAQRLDVIRGMTIDSAGSIYFSQNFFGRIRKLSPGGVLSTYAGNGAVGQSGDGGPALDASLTDVSSLSMNAAGELFISISPSNQFVCKVRKVSSSGVISTVAGNGTCSDSPDSGAATSQSLSFPRHVASDASGNLYIAAGRLRKVDSSGQISALTGASPGGLAVEGESAIAARLDVIAGMLGKPSGGVVYTSANRIRELAGGAITTLVGVSGSLSTEAQPLEPLALDASGSLYATAPTQHKVYRITTAGVVSVIAGIGQFGYSGDGGPSTAAMFNSPSGIVVDGSGNVLVADSNNQRIRKIDTAGVVSTIAGTGTAGFSPNGTAAASGQISNPRLLAISPSGELHFSESLNSRIRKINSAGNLVTVAGTGTSGNQGDGGAATAAQIGFVSGMVFDGDGNLYFSDLTHSVVRRISTAGIISTVAGTGVAGFTGDGGNPALARLNRPGAITLDAAGDLLIADNGNLRIRKLQRNVAPALPSPPVMGSATAGDGQVSVQFVASESGSSAIIDFTVSCRAASGTAHSATGPSSPILVTGLSNNTSYICTVRARNANGSGGESLGSLPVVPLSSTSYLVSVNKTGSGMTSGVITSLDGGISCGANCSAAYPEGARVTLYALSRPGTATALTGWSGVACEEVSGPACTFTVTAAVSATAQLKSVLSITGLASELIPPAKFRTLPFSICAGEDAIPSGAIEVLGSIYGPNTTIQLGQDLNGNQLLDSGEALATPLLNVSIPAGACVPMLARVGSGAMASGTTTQAVMSARNTLVSGSAPIDARTLLNVSTWTGTIGLTISGQGRVTASGDSALPYECTTSCSGQLKEPGTVVLTAETPTPGWQFVGWSGAACRSGLPPNYCEISYSVERTTNLNVVATFVPDALLLQTTKSGTGIGLVSSSPAGINCGGDCSESLASGTAVTLTAVPDPGSNFTSWSGVTCAGGNVSPNCSFTLTANTTVTATFDSSLVVSNDFNDDARSDLLWRNGGDGSVQGWLMNGLSATQVAGLLPPGGYTVTHVADLDGNGKADTLIRHTDGTTIGWLHDGLNVVGQATFFAPGSGWSIKHTADLNGDGKADLIVENTDGTVIGWLMNGLTVTGTATFVPTGTGWSVSRVGDLNGDGKADLIWQNTNGTVQAWLMNGLSATQTATFVGAGTGWSVKLTADFNGDNKADLVWQNTDGTVQAWLMDGTAISQIASFVPAGTGWSPVLAGDIDGDGKADLFWEHTDGRSQTWLMNGLSVTNLAGFVGAGGWKATHLFDLNGDGKKDVLWKHSDGTVQGWLMNGLSISQIASLASAGVYEVIPPRP